jgi:glycosyltransferase involved in cell wall biosynthesis
MKLSIIVPVYNEETTVDFVLKQLLSVDYPCPVEVMVVDDGSTDDTSQILDALSLFWQAERALPPRLVVLHHDRNRGKGAAVRSGAAAAVGDYLLIFDADLEYSPEDIPRLLQPVLDGKAELVFGTRDFRSHNAHSFWFVFGNKVTTLAANVLYDAWVNDLHSCLKLIPLRVFRRLELRQNGFGLDTEVTAKLLRAGLRPYEVPISYMARLHCQGKKLTLRDGITSIGVLFRVRVSRRQLLMRAATRQQAVAMDTHGGSYKATGTEPISHAT